MEPQNTSYSGGVQGFFGSKESGVSDAKGCMPMREAAHLP